MIEEIIPNLNISLGPDGMPVAQLKGRNRRKQKEMDQVQRNLFTKEPTIQDGEQRS